MATLSSSLPRVHKEGLPFILIAFFLAVLSLFLLSETLGWILILLTVYIVYFFRDPARVTPVLEGAAISPADGVVTAIEHSVPPRDLEMGDKPMLRISIFLSIFNVHVNRVPLSGKIAKLVYVPGKFLNATLDKSSEENERQLARVDLDDGRSAAFVQIAGLIARRIVCDLMEGEEVAAGGRFGIIRFGSRVDVYCPEGMKPMVAMGQTTVGGETILAADKPLTGGFEGRRS